MTNPFIIPIFKEKSGVVFSEIQTKCNGGALWWGTPEFSSRILGEKKYKPDVIKRNIQTHIYSVYQTLHLVFLRASQGETLCKSKTTS